MIRVMYGLLVVGCAVEAGVEAFDGDGVRCFAMALATVLLVMLRGELT